MDDLLCIIIISGFTVEKNVIGYWIDNAEVNMTTALDQKGLNSAR